MSRIKERQADIDREPTGAKVEEEFRSLMEGLRTTMPGAQVLLGFLFIVPFQAEFTSLSTTAQRLYLGAFFSAAMASILLIAPSVHQRFRAPRSGIARQNEGHVRAAVYISMVGSVFLGIAIGLSTALVVHVVGTGWPSWIGAAVVAAAIIYTWIMLPLLDFHDNLVEPPQDPGSGTTG